MTILVAEYLRAGGTYESLAAEHGVNAKPHNGKVSFVYDMLRADRGDALACQCRGLILREGIWDLVAYPFDRFFNHDEKPYAAELDWSTAAFEEKLDGTLIIAYWDDRFSRWLCATRSMCEAHGDINGSGTFATLADRVARDSGFGDFDSFMRAMACDHDFTYMFELTSPLNRLVVDYREFKLTLLGARNLVSRTECAPVWPDSHRPKRWEFSSFDDMVEVAKNWGPFEYEGVVVKDAAFRRIKAKAPAYLAAAHLNDSVGASWRATLELVRSGKEDDVIGVAPPVIADRIRAMRTALGVIVGRAETDLAALAGVDDMKTFALAAQKTAWSSPLFAVKRGKAESVTAFVQACHVDGLLDLCMKEIPETIR